MEERDFFALNRPEAQAYREGRMRFGLVTDAGSILTLWKFGDEPWIDAPFDAHVARAHGRLEPPHLDPTLRVVIGAHLVDTASGICRGIRAVTPAQSTALESALQDQLAAISWSVGLARLLATDTATHARRGEMR